jgi:hypothetical protein
MPDCWYRELDDALGLSTMAGETLVWLAGRAGPFEFPPRQFDHAAAYVKINQWANATSTYSRMGGIKPCEFRASSNCLERTPLFERKDSDLLSRRHHPGRSLAVLATLPTLDEDFRRSKIFRPEPVDL